MKIICAILMLLTLFLNIRHGWGGLTQNMKPEDVKMLAEIGIGKNLLLVISILSLAVCVLILFPQTFFIGNWVNAGLILLVMALALQAGNLKTALIEIPFLLMPLVMIWLGHPLAKQG